MSEEARQLREKRIGDSDSDFVMVEWEDLARSSEHAPIAPLHVHHSGDEAWYVLEGTLGVRLGDETVTVAAGASVIAKRGTPHTFWNAGTTPCRYIVVMSPPIMELIDDLHRPDNGGNKAQMKDIFRGHDSELL